MTSQKEFPTIYEHNALIFSFVAIAIVFVLLRLHRRYRDKALRLDDALCAIALLFTVWESVELHMQSVLQREVYYWSLSVSPEEFPHDDRSSWPPERQNKEQWIWRHGFLMVLSQGVALGLVKCSILVFYLRFIILKYPRLINYALISFTAVVTLWWFFMQFFETSPPTAIWVSDDFDYVFVVEPSLEEIIFSVLHITIDIALLLFPLPAIISLHLPRTEKAGLVLVYSTGFVSLGFTILGLYGNIRVRIGFDNDDWQSETIGHIWSGVWSNMELCTAVICACMPALSKMFLSCVRAMSRSFPESDVWSIHKIFFLNNADFGTTRTRTERVPSRDHVALPKRKSRSPLLPSTPETDGESIRPNFHHPIELTNVWSNNDGNGTSRGA